MGKDFEIQKWVETSKSFELRRFPREQREKVKDILDGKELVIEHNVRHGKIICHFIPIPADEIIIKDMRRQLSGEPTLIYQCGDGTREAHEKDVIKKMKAGASPHEMIEDFIKRQQIEGVSFYEPVASLATPYYFSEDLKELLPKFLNYLVEKIDMSKVSAELDERQTLDFISFEMAQRTSEIKRMLVEDFLAKHSNEPEIKRALGATPGGARKRKGFTWTKDSKIAFYRKVESLPKQENQSVWKYALSVLIEQEFDAETITWLKSRPAFKGIPDQLFTEAVRTWRKYLDNENWNEMRPEEKPRSFEYRHALYLLDYPDNFTYSTLDSHYYAGKKFSDSQNKT